MGSVSYLHVEDTACQLFLPRSSQLHAHACMTMEFQSIFLCALVLSLASCQYQLDGGQSRAIADYQDDGKHKAIEYPQVTVCPEDYSPHDDCVTLDQLMSGNLIKSNTTFKFQPATFELSSVIEFENVSNIRTLESAGAYKVDMTCVGNNTGFIFSHVSGLTIQNMMFSRCTAYDYLVSSSLVLKSSDIVLRNVTFRHGLGDGIAARNVSGHFTTMNSLFTHMQGTGLTYNNSRYYNFHYSSEQIITITNSQFDSHYYNSPGNFAYAVYIWIDQLLPTTTILLEDITITNNTHRSDSSGIYVCSHALNMTVKRVNYTNNLVSGELLSNTLFVHAGFHLNVFGSSRKCFINIIDSNFINNDFNNTSPVIESRYDVLHFSAKNSAISIKNTVIANNTGLYDAAISVNPSVRTYKPLLDLMFLLESSIIANNTIYVSDYYEKGAVQLTYIGNITVSNCSFVNNSVTGLFIYNSHVVFSGYSTIRGNRGYNGGGMALYTGSTIELLSETTISLEDNLAEKKGGGLVVQGVYNCFFFS